MIVLACCNEAVEHVAPSSKQLYGPCSVYRQFQYLKSPRFRSEKAFKLTLVSSKAGGKKNTLAELFNLQKENPAYRRWLELSRRELNPGLKRDKLAY